MKPYQIFIVFLCALGGIEADEPCLYFTSKEDVGARFVERVLEEKERVCLASHRLSQLDVIEALIQAHRRNVRVEVIVDSVSITKQTPLVRLLKEGIAVWVWQAESFGDKKKAPRRMYHAFCVFGRDLSWTGSYTFSLKSTFHHFESALVLKNEKIAKEFLEEFEEMKKNHVLALPLYLQQKGVSF